MKSMQRVAAALAAVLCLSAGHALAGDTLDSIQQRDGLLCGVAKGLPGFSAVDAAGNWTGFNVEFCRALAAAVLGNPDKVAFVALPADEMFRALQTGKIDVLVHDATCTFSRDADPSFHCAGTTYYDGLGFMAKKNLGARSAKDLSGTRICVESVSTAAQTLADFYSSRGFKYTPVPFSRPEQGLASYESGACEALAMNRASLLAYRLGLKKPDESVVLDDAISKEPLGPLVRTDDEKWFKVVLWTVHALVNAEELGVTSQNAIQARGGNDPQVQYLLGAKGNIGRKLGLNNDWIFQVVRQVGNYGEIYDRNLGEGGPLKIERRKNALWSKGGILYAPPIR